jgi:ParB family transcriptional regulator, chromosome partitioning protein
VELLTRLANEKLEKAAKQLRKKGAAWTETRINCDLSDASSFGRVRTIHREPTEGEMQRLKEIDTELTSINEAGGEQEEGATDRFEDLRDERQNIEDACEIPDPEQQAVAGAILTIDHDGSLLVRDGLLKPEDAARFRSNSPEKTARSAEPRVHSAALVRRLTAHRTAALRATLASNTDVAMAVLAHQLVRSLLLGRHQYGPVQIHGKGTDLNDHAADIAESEAYQEIESQLQSWYAQLPLDEERLLPWLLAQPPGSVQALVALCVAMSLDDVTSTEDGGNASQIRIAVELDMREWWEARADTYFASVPKARMAAVLREAVSEEVAPLLTPMRKSDAALFAEQQITGKGWLSEVLRTNK